MNRTCQVVINIEEPLFEAFAQLAMREGRTKSTLGRLLIIELLNTKGVLPHPLTLDILKGA